MIALNLFSDVEHDYSSLVRQSSQSKNAYNNTNSQIHALFAISA